MRPEQWRLIITLAALTVYTFSFNFYIYVLTHPFWDEHYTKLFYNYLTLSMLVFYLIDKYKGVVNAIHGQLNLMCILSVCINYIIIILNRHGLLSDAVKITMTFNGAIFVTTVMVMWFGLRDGYLQNNDENERAG